jgi:hypothetical protein
MILKIAALIVVVAALLYRFGRLYLYKRRIKNAADWPDTDAIIQSAKMEPVERIGQFREILPFFAFSYVINGEYFTGRFGLRVPEDRANTVMKEWINNKINVQYDPKRPSVFCLPEVLSVDGLRVDTVPEVDLASKH